jgi:hypothetical protein
MQVPRSSGVLLIVPSALEGVRAQPAEVEEDDAHRYALMTAMAILPLSASSTSWPRRRSTAPSVVAASLLSSTTSRRSCFFD